MVLGLLIPFPIHIEKPKPVRPVEIGIVYNIEPPPKPLEALKPIDVQPMAAIEPIAPPAPSTTPRAGNLYAYGWCTWGVANWVQVPQDLGDAKTWAVRAEAEGFTVSPVPILGAVAQTSAGWGGHVALVIGIDNNRVLVREMNGTLGWNQIDERWSNITDWVYIYF